MSRAREIYTRAAEASRKEHARLVRQFISGKLHISPCGMDMERNAIIDAFDEALNSAVTTPGSPMTDKMTDSPEEMLASIGKLMDQVERLRETLATVMRQSEYDLRSAHAEICKLQGIDPAKHDWPEWTPQANSIRWFAVLREQFGINDPVGGAS